MINPSPSDVSTNSDVTNAEPNVLSCQIGSLSAVSEEFLDLLSSFQGSS